MGDRLGLDIRVTKRGLRRNKLVTDEFRLGFRIPVISVEDAKSEIQKIFRRPGREARATPGETTSCPAATCRCSRLPKTAWAKTILTIVCVCVRASSKWSCYLRYVSNQLRFLGN